MQRLGDDISVVSVKPLLKHLVKLMKMFSSFLKIDLHVPANKIVKFVVFGFATVVHPVEL